MDCESVRQHAGSAIDGFLENDLANEFQAHLERCKPCRDDIGSEKLSKKLIRRYVSWISTPPSIHSLIVTALRHEYDLVGSTDISWINTNSRFRVFVPALAGGVVAAAFFFVTGVSSEKSLKPWSHTAENDFMRQSLETLQLLQTGRFVPAIVTSVPESMGTFFQKGALPFEVRFPRISGFDWFGGATSDTRGTRQAHLVYKMGNEWVYICEMSSADGMDGVRYTLPPAAKNALAGSGLYIDPSHPNCNVVLWKENEVIFVAVSTIGKKKLLSLLSPMGKLQQ